MQVARPGSVITASLITLTLLTGCPGPGQDVRVALCQDMTAIELGTAPTWQGTDTRLQGYQDAVVVPSF